MSDRTGGIVPGILLVYAREGVPPSSAIPKVAAIADTHLLLITPLRPSVVPAASLRCSSVTDVSGEGLRADEPVGRIV
ncbi:MAG TPA: hypothetical protein VGD11_07010, partial [Mycobacteriales bacterium]